MTVIFMAGILPRWRLLAALAAFALGPSVVAQAQQGPLVDGRPGATVLPVQGPDDIEPIYAFPPNCLPIIGVPNSGLNRLLANIDGGPVRIAVLAELSGGRESLGRAWRDGILMAADLANGKGGIMGRRFEIRSYDVAASPAALADAAAELLREPPFAVFGPLTEGNGAAAVDALRRAQIPMILGTAGGDLLTQQEAWVARGLTTPLSRLMQLADHAREEFKARTAAVVWSATDYGRQRRDALFGALARRRIQLTVDAEIALGQEAFPDLLARLRTREPDVLFLMAHGVDAVRILTALRRQGYSGSILIDGDVVDRGFLAAAGENANGLRGIAALHAGAPVARVRAMAGRFAAHFGYAPPAPGVNGFAALNILKGAVERACSFNTPDILKMLRNVRIETRSDPGLLLDARLDAFGNLLRDEFVFEIRNGAPGIVALQHAPLGYN